VPVEVLQEGGPIERHSVLLEVLERKRETVVDPNESRLRGEQLIGQPFGDAPPRPILAWLGGGCTSLGTAPDAAMKTRRPLRLETGV
jgi:hypothetical protein